MEPTETYRVTQHRQNENSKRNQQRPRRERQINARRRGNAFAAFELQPAGVIVAEHGENAGDDAKTFYSNFVRSMSNIPHQQGECCLIQWQKSMQTNGASQADGGITFQRVQQQHDNPRRFAEHAHGVRRADVAAADGADVNALRLRHEKAGRNRAEQIRGERGQDVSDESARRDCRTGVAPVSN